MSLLNDALRKHSTEPEKKVPIDFLKSKLKGTSIPKNRLNFLVCGGGGFFLALFVCWQVFFSSASASLEQVPDKIVQVEKEAIEKSKPVLSSKIMTDGKIDFPDTLEEKELKVEKIAPVPKVIAKIDLLVKKKSTGNRVLEKNSKKNVKLKEIFYKKALTYQKGNNFKQAIRMYREVLKNNPAHQDALLNIGVCYIKKSEFSNAIIYLEKLKKLPSESCEGLINLAVAQIEVGRFDKSLVCLNEAETLTKNPRFEIFLYRGLASIRLGKSGQALRWYRKAEQLLPKNPILLFNMAILFDQQKSYSEAVKYYSTYLRDAVLLSNEEKKAIEKRVLLITAFMKSPEDVGMALIPAI